MSNNGSLRSAYAKLSDVFQHLDPLDQAVAYTAFADAIEATDKKVISKPNTEVIEAARTEARRIHTSYKNI